MADVDREKLASFLRNLYGFMERGIGRHADALPETYREELPGLWERQETALIAAIEELSYGVDAEELDRALETFGLTGGQLDLKLRLYDDAVRVYEEAPTAVRFSDVLGAANITLGSLALLLPILHGIEELKGIVEYLLARGRGWLRRHLWPFGR